MNKRIWFHKLRIWWVCFITVAMLLNLDQFGAASGIGPQPKYWAVALFVISVPIFLLDGRSMRILHSPLTWWGGAYLVWSALWMLHASDSESAMNGLLGAVTTNLYLLTAVMVYPSMSADERIWGFVLWSALLLAVSSVLFEYYLPNFYAFSEVGQGIVGRSAGFYLNPNAAGLAILMILSCLVTRSSSWSSVVAALVALCGIMATFSRASILGWLAVAVIVALRGRRPRLLLFALVASGIWLAFAGALILETITPYLSLESQNTQDRLAWLSGQGNLNDDAAGDRQWILGFAWNEFLTAPVFGHGLGYTMVWDAEIGTHNLILRHLVEYGAFGFLIFPLFLWSGIRSGDTALTRRTLAMIAGVIIIMSFFSHNMLEQGFFLFPWLAACLMPSSKKLRVAADMPLLKPRAEMFK